MPDEESISAQEEAEYASYLAQMEGEEYEIQSVPERSPQIDTK